MRRAAAVLAIMAGVVLVALPLAYGFFDRTTEAERILDRFEFLTLGDGPARYLAEAGVTRAGSTELVEEALPALLARARADGAALPALAAAQRQIPRAHDFSVRYSRQLDAVDEKFGSVYDIPAGGLSLTATPWLFLGGGVAFALAGMAVLRTTGSAALIALAVLGAATVAVPTALGAVAKSADAEDVKDFADRGLTARAAGTANDASGALDALVAETRSQALPLIAGRRGMTANELRAELRRGYPAAARFLAEWRTIGPRLSRLADAVSASVREYASVRKMPIALPVWVLMAAGLATALVAVAALVPRARGAR